MQTIKSQLTVAVLAAVCQASSTEYSWEGPTLFDYDKTLISSGKTGWTTKGTGVNRKLTRYLTQTLEFVDSSHNLEAGTPNTYLNQQIASVYTCFPDLGDAIGYRCLG